MSDFTCKPFVLVIEGFENKEENEEEGGKFSSCPFMSIRG